MIPALDRLQCLMDAALKRVDDKEWKRLADSLAAHLHEVTDALAGIAVSDDVSSSMRLRASDLLFRAFSRLTKTDQKISEAVATAERAKARRQQFEAKKHRARADEKGLALRERQQQEKRAKRLADALSQIGGTQ